MLVHHPAKTHYPNSQQKTPAIHAAENVIAGVLL